VIPLKDNVRLAHVPIVTIALIVGNVVAYLLASAHGGSIIGGPTNETLVRYGAIPYEFTHFGRHCDLGLSGLGQSVLCNGQAGVAGTPRPQPATWLTAFTAIFLHVNVLQLTLNMVFLAVFGTSVEDAMGRIRFVGFYVLGGLAALAVAIVLGPDSVDPALGAAGAIAAVLGAYALLYPRGRILSVVLLPFFFTIVEVPAWAMLALWFIFEGVLGLLGLTSAFGAGAGIAYGTYVGGFAFGLLAVRAFARRHSGELAAVGPSE
jgi:membrane associated rhomboid family serine protease